MDFEPQKGAALAVWTLAMGSSEAGVPLSDSNIDQQGQSSPSPIRVLLAEDNPADVMVVEEILHQQKAEFEITVASDGQQAIELVRGLDRDTSLPAFDIALVDLNLPRHTGHEVLAEVRKGARTGNIPVIIVTSSRSPKDVKRARELGATEYFEKVADLDAYSALGPLILRTLDRSRSNNI
jgi:CheY-like chemotaxis protein